MLEEVRETVGPCWLISRSDVIPEVDSDCWSGRIRIDYDAEAISQPPLDERVEHLSMFTIFPKIEGLIAFQRKRRQVCAARSRVLWLGLQLGRISTETNEYRRSHADGEA